MKEKIVERKKEETKKSYYMHCNNEYPISTHMYPNYLHIHKHLNNTYAITCTYNNHTHPYAHTYIINIYTHL